MPSETKPFIAKSNLGVVPRSAALTPRPSWVPSWDELSLDEHRLYARMMEVYAGFLTHTDAQIGRLLDCLSALRILDNTLILCLSDNGASAEGGPTVVSTSTPRSPRTPATTT
jgi:arylsulfatase A-like enzyme